MWLDIRQQAKSSEVWQKAKIFHLNKRGINTLSSPDDNHYGSCRMSGPGNLGNGYACEYIGLYRSLPGAWPYDWKVRFATCV